MKESVQTLFNVESMAAVIGSIEASSLEMRERETKAAEERARQTAAAFGGLWPGPGGPAMPAPMNVRTFVEKRVESIMRQLKDNDPGYIPTPPNFGGGFGPPGRQADQAPITEAQCSESVQVPSDFTATLFARSPEVNYPVAISAEPTGAIDEAN